ncbi:MAG: prolipoprotein diacylglyceryl transferase [Candidatus Eremiobacteraeota bacterium]|nr:prolipoprotein diacylglyceryl transferase [Candidatus Eremiobacteraeota bacterium]
MLAYAIGIGAFAAMARRRGLATDGIAYLAGAGLLGGAIGAQAMQSIVGGVPGKSLLGGVACGYLAVVYAKHRLGIRRPTGDLFAVALAAGEAVGRFGCFFAGCCYGKVTTLPWGVYEHGALRHPTQLYSAAAAALTLLVLVVLERRGTLAENGIFYVQGALMCAFRFAVDFARDVPVLAGGLTTAQFAAALGFAFFAWRFAVLVRRAAASPLAVPSPVRAFAARLV